MADLQVIVTRIRQLDPPIMPPSGPNWEFTRVLFADAAEEVRLDMKPKGSVYWFALLSQLSRTGQLAYLGIDRLSRIIQVFLLPRPFSVRQVALLPINGRWEIHLHISAAKHFVLQSNRNQANLLDLLRSAAGRDQPLLITERLSGNEIIDVREVPGPMPLFRQRETGYQWKTALAREAIGPDVAQNLFNLVNAQACDPLMIAPLTCDPNVPMPGCIPFAYPDDGCWDRAHEMYRLIQTSGLVSPGQLPRKIWNCGDIQICTPNYPDCFPPFSYHVALSVLLTDGSIQILDPTFFPNGPTSPSEWLAAQGTPGAIPLEADPEIYWLDCCHPLKPGNEYDPNYQSTWKGLCGYRQLLLDRVGDQATGPPPYLNCSC
jgi:hypothetical protein